MNYEIGTLLIGNADSDRYAYTTSKSLCIVLGEDYDCIEVGILAHDSFDEQLGKHYEVYPEYFDEVTIEEYFAKFPNASICGRRELALLNRFRPIDIDGLLQQLEEKSSQQRQQASETASQVYEKVMSTEQYIALRNEMMTLLEQFGYKPTVSSLDKILGEWVTNKADLIEMFKKHPNYNGKFQIVFDYDYERVADPYIINSFCHDSLNSDYLKATTLQELVLEHPYKVCQSNFENYDTIRGLMTSYSDTIETINGLTYNEVKELTERWRAELRSYATKGHRSGDKCYTEESYNRWMNIRQVFNFLKGVYHATFTEYDADTVNSYFPELKAKSGQKTSRVTNKLCKMCGLDKEDGYNKRFAAYSDAINPLKIKRHTIISVHPIDYLTMSFGNSWSSCHTIDKRNIRKSQRGYHGEYSSGTLSYMMDGTSMILYTVDASYEGNEYELQDKINRNMFHFGNNKLIQGRVYPQDNDGENSIYTTFREITQKILSECMDNGVNAWLVSKGNADCDNVVESHGTHYRDYLFYDNCNVSYYNKEKDMKKIVVGHDPICPSCGRKHRRESNIECNRCD